MSETPPIYHTQQDSGDETDVRPKETPMAGKSNTQYDLTGSAGDAPSGPWVGDHDAAYWHAQALDAQREVGYCHAQAATDLRALEQAEAELTQAHAERDAVTRQLDEAEAHNTDLLADAARFLAERDAALAQLTAVKRQLAVTGDTLYAERRAAVAQQRRSHLD